MNSQYGSTPPSPPDDPRDNVAAFSIGATDRVESEAVARLIADDPALRRDAADFAAAATMLNASVPRVEPPAALKGKILAAAQVSRRPALTVLPHVGPAIPTSRIRDVLVFVASAAAVLLLGLNVYWMTQVNDLREREAAAAAASRDMEMAVALLTSVESERIELMDDEGSMRAMVVFEPGQSEALIVTHDLPVLSSDQTYQLWQISADGTPVSAGVFATDEDGEMSIIFRSQMPWSAVSALGVSVEPMGGSTTPTTTPIAVGAMA
jgi:anti-sigma-K factor RskA